jgi:MOSC domain-containing protein YiiM
MTPLSAVHLVPGRGIAGDRYYLGLGSFPSGDLPAYEVSLIEEDMYRELAREALLRDNGKALRRNIVVSGRSLATLIEQPFQIGTVVLRGLVPRRLRHLSIEQLATMRMPSGIGAQVLTEGDISLGDEVRRITRPSTALERSATHDRWRG